MANIYANGTNTYSNYDDFIEKGTAPTKVPLWNSFQSSPPPKTDGSAASSNKFATLLKCFKLFMYVFVFFVILITTVISKASYLLMVAQLKPSNVVKFCDTQYPNKEFHALIPQVQRKSWIWALIFSFMVPEILQFLRSFRICFFKQVKATPIFSAVVVAFMETLHVLGLSILTFVIFPVMSSANALMLTCSVCFVPGFLNLFRRFKFHWTQIVAIVLSVLAVLAQSTSYVVWPVVENKFEFYLIPLALFLVSFRWWENYLPTELPRFQCLARLSEMNHQFLSSLSETRPYIYLYVSVWKIFVFALSAFILNGGDIFDYFTEFSESWRVQKLYIQEVLLFSLGLQIFNILFLQPSVVYTDRLGNTTGPHYSTIVSSQPEIHIAITLTHALASFVCYSFAKLACKIKIQEIGFSLPLSIAVPITLIPVITFSVLRDANVCSLHGFLPDYIAFNGLPDLFDYLSNAYMWVWLLWWLSQAWITRHIWSPSNFKNAPTVKLFVAPVYSSFVVDQCILLNRRRVDNEEVEINDDSVPHLVVCATMWHEERDEIMEFLKSIVRLDQEQGALKNIKQHFFENRHYAEYFELETHVFFDDAFLPSADKEEPPPLNEYVRNFIECVPEAVKDVYGVRVPVKPPLKIETPYGGRLVWTLTCQTKLYVHLKDKTKIRNKKRWSQVMYMYYLLGFQIMSMKDVSPTRKQTIAENKFLLALDGDIDFQPHAVHLLLNRMKVNRDLGAACGRIHPVGKGAITWLQVFEYAIGHWLQKATEHVIGCVLCSPGCFSLFRGSALMEPGVMKTYTTESTCARHAVQYDQGEDRWLCTLLLKQKYRVEYCAASDSYTHCPEEFSVLFIQRRRWMPSTIANIFELLADKETVVKNNNSISTPYMWYQAALMLGTILGPGTIFLMMVGAFVTTFSISILTSFIWNFIPVITFMLICYFCKHDHHLTAAFVISSFYAFVMMAVLIGIIIQVMDDGILSPASLFFIAVVVQIIVTGLLHPQEAGALICGVMYYITIPSMYMLLMIYSVFNMNNVKWGTRENTNQTIYVGLPNWLEDPLLEGSDVSSLDPDEEQFWEKLIEEYLTPELKKMIDEKKDPKQEETKKIAELKTLRDSTVFGFVMINSLFVLVVLLLQIKKDYMHIRWPYNAKNNITYDETRLEVTIYRDYLQLDPIGLLFVVFFGIILLIQFLAMLMHRLGTMSEVLANVSLDWFNKKDLNTSKLSFVEPQHIDFVKFLQRPTKFLLQDRSDSTTQMANESRKTVHKILLARETEAFSEKDWIPEENFKKNVVLFEGNDVNPNIKRFLEIGRKSVMHKGGATNFNK